MDQEHLIRRFYLDYSNRQELYRYALPEGGYSLEQSPAGTALCALLNLGVPHLEKMRALLYKLLPMNTADADAYSVMLSINIGNTPLPDSPYAAKLFALLDNISELHPVFYIAMQIDRLLSQLEQEAPEKKVMKFMAATAARAAQTLDTAIEILPVFRARMDASVNFTVLEEKGLEKRPLLARVYSYEKKSGDPVLRFEKPPAYTLMAREKNDVLTVEDGMKLRQNPPDLFYGDTLNGKPLPEMLDLLFRQFLTGETVVRVCGVCGRYFIPSVRSNEKYCDHVEEDANGAALSCKQRSTKNRLENDPSLRLLKGAYDKNFIKANRIAKKKDPDYRQAVFKPWYAWAKQQRKDYLEGKLTLEGLTERLGRKMENYLD